jgi:formamidopyrimidine-DNA glycosylase
MQRSVRHAAIDPSKRAKFLLPAPTMPELPEVEVTRLSFASRIRGATVQAVALGKPLRWPLGCNPQHLVGATVQGVRRRGKYLLMDLNLPGQAEPGLLLMHLGMSGRMAFHRSLGVAGKHDHFELQTDRGTLRLTDPRRFGAVVYADGQEAPGARKLLQGLGMEPLQEEGAERFDPLVFAAGLKARRTAIKTVLLAGDLVVGVGNIYCSEALFMAGIRPTRRAERITRAQAMALHRSIREVLARAVELGGSTLRDFANAHGEDGHFQLQAKVYGREGQPCSVCGTTIRRIVQGQRSTFYCPSCQP